MRHSSPIYKVRESISEPSTHENNEIDSPKHDKQPKILKSKIDLNVNETLIRLDTSN